MNIPSESDEDGSCVRQLAIGSTCHVSILSVTSVTIGDRASVLFRTDIPITDDRTPSFRSTPLYSR